jgi:outer membrane usher protein
MNVDGEPIALLTGTAVELAHPEREPITIFTNREGRFAATGLAPGRWKIQMNDPARTTFFIEVPGGESRLLRTGDLRPSER